MPFTPDDNLIEIRGRMSELFIKQKAQGGIIDVEAEKNKYLLEISAVRYFYSVLKCSLYGENRCVIVVSGSD